MEEKDTIRATEAGLAAETEGPKGLYDEEAARITDEQLSRMIDGLGEDDPIPEPVMKAFKEDLKEYIKRDEQISEELAKIQEEYARLLESVDREYQQLMDEMDLDGVLERMEKLIGMCEQAGNARAAAHFRHMAKELRSSFTLEIMMESVPKIKNRKNSVRQALDPKRFAEEFAKFRRNLEKNTRYRFIDPEGLPEELAGKVGEEVARVFLYGLARSTNTRGQRAVEENSVFIGQLIKNLTLLDDERFLRRDELIESIRGYYEAMTAA